MSFAPRFYSHETVGKCLLLHLAETSEIKQRAPTCHGLIKTLAAIAMEPRELRISALEVGLSPSLAMPSHLASREDLESTRELFHTARYKITFTVSDERCKVGFHLRAPVLGNDERVLGPALVLAAFWHILQKMFLSRHPDFAQTLFDAVLRGILEHTRVDSARIFASLAEVGYTPVHLD